MTTLSKKQVILQSPVVQTTHVHSTHMYEVILKVHCGTFSGFECMFYIQFPVGEGIYLYLFTTLLDKNRKV